jgi:hypothetical protein
MCTIPTIPSYGEQNGLKLGRPTRRNDDPVLRKLGRDCWERGCHPQQCRHHRHSCLHPRRDVTSLHSLHCAVTDLQRDIRCATIKSNHTQLPRPGMVQYYKSHITQILYCGLAAQAYYPIRLKFQRTNSIFIVYTLGRSLVSRAETRNQCHPTRFDDDVTSINCAANDVIV